MKIKEFNKLELLTRICKWYGYELTIADNIICKSSSNGYEMSSVTVEDCLVSWLTTLESTDEEYEEFGEQPIWEDEIKFIKSLEFEKISDEELGKMIALTMSTDIYTYKIIDWNEIDNKLYQELGEEIRNQKDCYSDFRICYIQQYNMDDDNYIFIDTKVQDILLKDYYLNNDLGLYVPYKTEEKLIQLLKDNQIPFNVKTFKNGCVGYIVKTIAGKCIEIFLDNKFEYTVYFDDLGYTFEVEEDLIDFINHSLNEYEDVEFKKISDLDIKDQEDLLKEVCDYYSCCYEIKEDGTVELEDFIEASCENVTVALKCFYDNFLTEDWDSVEDVLKCFMKEDKKVSNNSFKIEYNVTATVVDKKEDGYIVMFTEPIIGYMSNRTYMCSQFVSVKKGDNGFYIDNLVFTGSEDIELEQLVCDGEGLHNLLNNVCENVSKTNDSGSHVDYSDDNYIVLSNGDLIEFESFEDLRLGGNNLITYVSLSVCSQFKKDTFKEYIGKSLTNLSDDIEYMLYDVFDENEEALLGLLDVDPSLKSWVNNDAIFYYNTNDMDYAISTYLHYQEDLSEKTLLYMDKESYFENECKLKTITGGYNRETDYIIFYKNN